MWHITKWALRSRLITILLALVVAGASWWAFTGIKVELMPDISLPYTTVVTVYPQATPDAVVRDVTTPIERFIWDEWSDQGLKHLTSTSSGGMSVIMAEFEYGTDMTAVTESLNEGIGEINFPQAVTSFAAMMGADAKNPQIIPINMNIMPMISLSLSGDLPPDQLKEIADSQIVPALSQLDGVLRVDTEGGEKDYIVISPDPAKMAQYGITISQIAGIISAGYSSVSEMEQIPLGESGLKLSDVASVSLSPSPSSAITRTNGKPSVGISIIKTEAANTVETAKAINEKITALQGTLGDGVSISTVFDQSDFIDTSISQLEEKAVVGGILAVLVVFFFLWAVRASLIAAISIPLSIFFGFLCMSLFGITLNILTLSAMTIAVGRLIDDSIVIIEVIYRRLRTGESFKEAAIGGAKEVATPITTATLATVAIFAPLMFVGGIVGELFIPFALTVTFAMLASLIVALTLIPALSKWLVGAKQKAVVTKDNWYQKIYVKALKWTLGHRLAVVATAVILLIGSTGLLPMAGTSFMSGSFGEETIAINISLPSTADVNDTSALTAKVEAILGANPAVRSYSATIGTSATSMAGIMSASEGGGGANTATITVYLTEGADLQTELSNITVASQAISTEGVIQVSSGSGDSMGGSISSSSINLSIQGQNQEEIAAITAQLLEMLEGVDGLTELKSDLTTVVPVLNIEVDPAKVAASGISAAQLAQLQQEFVLLMNGGALPGTTVTLESGSYPVYFKGIAERLTDAEQAKSLKIGFPVAITLSDIANVGIAEVASHISHTDTMLSATITGLITDANVGAVNMAVQEQVDALPAHPGVEVVTAGIAEQMGDTFTQMGIAILVAIAIVFLIVILMMRSIRNPLLIMLSIPLAFIGSMLALVITGYTLGVSALMGLLMLVGIVLTNAIVLVSMVEQQRKRGLSVKDALIEGGKIRLRPIVMTALTTILAMIPMALSVSSGTVLSAELAVVVIGGMVSSTFLTLFVIPAVYSMVYRGK
ncbi:MAG: efflux RND transporter permease subunit [Dehalococcoides mccartyi]|uniref:efflux RND transporter permease subunit n=1 Tax=Dehalococcoides mccartyi TaxID=61435 RepID=UPI0004E07A90|nr:efflux RND transporter permease subunit [Dehalococcoides mccartyi]AII60048.1 membrane protein [Dehalococcoides mccartyi CG4]